MTPYEWIIKNYTTIHDKQTGALWGNDLVIDFDNLDCMMPAFPLVKILFPNVIENAIKEGKDDEGIKQALREADIENKTSLRDVF